MSELSEALKSIAGLKIESRFCGYVSKKEDPSGWEHFSWKVTISVEGDPEKTIGPINYRTGVGHLTEAGKARQKKDPNYQTPARLATDPVYYVAKPSLADVIYGLLSDAQCGEDTFDEFCANLGYNTDSRKAFNTYIECQKTIPMLRRLFGDKVLHLQGLEH